MLWCFMLFGPWWPVRTLHRYRHRVLCVWCQQLLVMDLSHKITFTLPPYLGLAVAGDNNKALQIINPSLDTLLDIEAKVIHLYHSQQRYKRHSDGGRESRRYLVYDRPPEKKKKKKKRKCPSSNGISAFTFLNFAMGAVSLAANVVNNINRWN